MILDGACISNQAGGNNDLSSRQVRANLFHENNEVHNHSPQNFPVMAVVPVPRKMKVVKPEENWSEMNLETLKMYFSAIILVPGNV